MNSAMKVADRIVMLYETKLIFDGTPEETKATRIEAVRRFVHGEASEQELQTLELPGK
jgi:ABC-type transporter Mla maintaining outer membrane lipid asymmetry ATPase subunit MlaF